MEVEVRKEVKELGKMTLLDRIALLNRPQWTPPVCAKCGERNQGMERWNAHGTNIVGGAGNPGRTDSSGGTGAR